MLTVECELADLEYALADTPRGLARDFMLRQIVIAESMIPALTQAETYMEVYHA